MHALGILRWFLPVLIAAVWVGCDRQPDAQSLAAPSEEAAGILARADSVDGVEDKVVDKCLTCSLGMDGSADHAVTFGAYELHFCSAACRNHFAADPEKAVLSVELPASSE